MHKLRINKEKKEENNKEIRDITKHIKINLQSIYFPPYRIYNLIK